MDNSLFITIDNGSAVSMSKVPVLETETFRKTLIEAVNTEKNQLFSFFALPENDKFKLIAILGDAAAHKLKISSGVIDGVFQSMAAEAPAFELFEREIAEQYPAITIAGHPELNPVRNPDQTQFYKMSGDAVHEVAVGPIHAGVIEPGHFRFQCMGEDVYFLQIALGYQHRGIEKMMQRKLDNRFIHFVETASGDTAAAAATAWSHVIEALSGNKAAQDACQIRSIAIELERIACHTGDLGALSGDVAYLPTASFCGRIRGEYLNMTAELCGNRFGRGIAVPGGCRTSLEKARAEKILAWIERVRPELYHALDLMFDSPTVLDRFENTGTVSRETAESIGLVGVAARASGLKCDVRHDYPLPEYGGNPPAFPEIDVQGDVIARARIRYEEIKASHAYLEKVLKEVPAEGLSAAKADVSALEADTLAVSVVEAWRGALCYAAVTGNDGTFRRVKIVDPSFHNWTGLAFALRGEQISHFPICNKSFNLSYCGYDL